MWEYHQVYKSPFDESISVSEMNDLGKCGWELVSNIVEDTSFGASYKYTFKRERK